MSWCRGWHGVIISQVDIVCVGLEWLAMLSAWGYVSELWWNVDMWCVITAQCIVSVWLSRPSCWVSRFSRHSPPHLVCVLIFIFFESFLRSYIATSHVVSLGMSHHLLMSPAIVEMDGHSDVTVCTIHGVSWVVRVGRHGHGDVVRRI